MGAHGKRGRRPSPSASCLDFVHWTNVNMLTHLSTSSSLYTWHNGRFGAENVALSLDRSVCNEEWLNIWRHMNCCALVRHQSDQHPLLLFVDASSVTHVVSFNFSNLVLLMRIFGDWLLIIGRRMLEVLEWFVYRENLKNLKQVFKHWNCTVVGDVDRQVRLVIDEVNHIQQLIDSEGFSNDLYAQDLAAQLLLTTALNCQDQPWKEKARDQSFIHGIQNTSYFHRVAKIRAASKNISLLYDGDKFISEPVNIENDCISSNLVARTIPSVVTQEDNQFLLRLPLCDEIKAAVFDLNGDGAPGPDDFGGHLYQKFWDIMETDVIKSMQEFFVIGVLAPNIKPNLIVLIHKVPGA